MLSEGWEHTNSWVALERPEYIFELDEFRRGDDQMVFVHLWVKKWAPRVFKQIIREWRAFRKVAPGPLYAVGEDDDSKWERFVRTLGFEELTDAVCENGEQRRVFISLPKNNKEHPNVGQFKTENHVEQSKLN